MHFHFIIYCTGCPGSVQWVLVRPIALPRLSSDSEKWKNSLDHFAEYNPKLCFETNFQKYKEIHPKTIIFFKNLTLHILHPKPISAKSVCNSGFSFLSQIIHLFFLEKVTRRYKINKPIIWVVWIEIGLGICPLSIAQLPIEQEGPKSLIGWDLISGWILGRRGR